MFSELLSNLYSRGNEQTLLEESAEQADQGFHLLRAAVQPALAWEPEDNSCRSRQSRHSDTTRYCFSELLSNLYSRGNENTLLKESAEQADQGVHHLGAAVQPVLAWE